MKIIIFYVLSFMIISASAIQPSFDRIVIKLRTNNHTIGTKSNDSNTLDAIAIGLNSNISNLFHIPLLPL